MRVLVTGHLGFIGSTVWHTLKNKGIEVWGLDDLSRSTSKEIKDSHSIIGNVIDLDSILALDQDFDWVIHLAGQVSVIAGESQPHLDFSTNALGTFKVTQWAKQRGAGIIYSSTNKVFGELIGRSTPILDSEPYKPQTNYGVSKASGAHYVADYARGYVLHQSCIYGGTQIGELDQGWIGWLWNSVKGNREITCFGDGSQVRDLLHVDDLTTLYLKILEGGLEAGSYVTGGGESNSATFSDVVEFLGGEIKHFREWRPHDQRYFVSANEGLVRSGWQPQIDWRTGLLSVMEN